MSTFELHKLWSGGLRYSDTTQLKKLVNTHDQITWHFAAFRSLKTRKSKLLETSLGTNALRGTAGAPFHDRSKCFLASCFLRQVHKQHCWKGEKSIWDLLQNGRPTGIEV